MGKGWDGVLGMVREYALSTRVATGADKTKANTLERPGAPQNSDLRLVEDGSERDGALVSDAVEAIETARDGSHGRRR